MPEPFTMTFLAVKWLGAHLAGAHAAGHAAAAHAGLTTTILGTTIAASTIGGITFINVYKRVVDDVYDEVKKGRRPKPSPQEMREISDTAYEMTLVVLKEKRILPTAADRNEMDSLRRKVDYAFAA